MATPAPATEVPGTGNTTPQDDDQGVIVQSAGKDALIAAAGVELDRIDQEREKLSAERRACLETCVADGVSRKAIERAKKDSKLDPEKLERHDIYYERARSVFGHPVQGRLFPDATKH